MVLASGIHTKPPPVRLNPPRLRLILSLLESCSLDDLARLVADGFAAIEHLETTDCLRIVVEVLPFDLFDMYTGRRGARFGRSRTLLGGSHGWLACRV